MKVSIVIKGFIDPRRGDIIRINLSADSIDDAKKQRKETFGHINGRESWYLLEGSEEKIGRFSGNGPPPPFPTPEGDIVNLTINI